MEDAKVEVSSEAGSFDDLLTTTGRRAFLVLHDLFEPSPNNPIATAALSQVHPAGPIDVRIRLMNLIYLSLVF